MSSSSPYPAPERLAGGEAGLGSGRGTTASGPFAFQALVSSQKFLEPIPKIRDLSILQDDCASYGLMGSGTGEGSSSFSPSRV